MTAGLRGEQKRRRPDSELPGQDPEAYLIFKVYMYEVPQVQQKMIRNGSRAYLQSFHQQLKKAVSVEPAWRRREPLDQETARCWTTGQVIRRKAQTRIVVCSDDAFCRDTSAKARPARQRDAKESCCQRLESSSGNSAASDARSAYSCCAFGVYRNG